MDPLLIRTLSDGQYHSGQHLGELLGMSRTAVWKHLQKLTPLGIDIETVKGRGYRIPGGLELLDGERIRDAMGHQSKDRVADIVIFQSLDSTNAYIASMANGGHRVVCLAEHQRRGRGRRGRSWSSPFGRNIYLSLGWQFQDGAASIEGLSLAVGLAVRRALGGGDQLRLKWPNDLLYDGRKLAGILLEMQGDPSGQCQVVVGIGVNAGMAGRERPDVDQPWADAGEITGMTRNEIAGGILDQVLPLMENYTEHRFAACVDEWNRWDAYRNRPVRLITPAREFQGIARGVADNGAIRIEIDGKIQAFNGGELSLRPV